MSRGGRRPGAGRPLSAGEPRKHRLELQLSEAEFAELTVASGEASLAVWLRDVGLATARRVRPG